MIFKSLKLPLELRKGVKHGRELSSGPAYGTGG